MLDCVYLLSKGWDHSGIHLKAMLCLQGVVFFVEGVDTIDHLLHKLNLGVSQPVLVGDVVGDAGLAARLTTGS